MTPTAMESGTIAEIDGWPGAMNMPFVAAQPRLLRSSILAKSRPL